MTAATKKKTHKSQQPPADPLHGALSVSVADAARLFDVSPKTLWRRIADGSVPSLKLGRRRLIPAWYLRRNFIDGPPEQAAA